MKVSVVIPVYKDWESLKTCLKAIQNQSFPAEYTQIIVVNNGTIEEVPKDFEWPVNCKLLHEERPGSYAARNKALSEIKGEIVSFTDADCTPGKEWLASMYEKFQSDPDVDFIGGQINIDTTLQSKNVANIYELLFSLDQRKYVSRGWTATANMSTRRELFDKVGDFDPVLMSGGDQEWGRRATAQGYKIQYSSSAYVSHPPRSSKSLITKARRITGGKLEKRIRRKGKKKVLFSYLATAVFCILPPVGNIKKIAACKEISLYMRFRLYLFMYMLKLAKAKERGRLLLGEGKPERE